MGAARWRPSRTSTSPSSRPWKPTDWTETVVEAILYLLWDLGLKVGHSARSVDELIRLAAADHTIRTAILEARYVWGDEALYDEVSARFWKAIGAGNIRAFVKEKLDERDARHKRMGDSRYVVEPNIKEGKGGLRDLHTLFWIGKYAYRVTDVAGLVEAGLLSAGRAPPVPARRALPVGGALPPPHRRRPGRGAADLRLSARDRGADELCRPAGQIGRSSASCAIISCTRGRSAT